MHYFRLGGERRKMKILLKIKILIGFGRHRRFRCVDARYRGIRWASDGSTSEISSKTFITNLGSLADRRRALGASASGPKHRPEHLAKRDFRGTGHPRNQTYLESCAWGRDKYPK